jgi:hypothetical protein
MLESGFQPLIYFKGEILTTRLFNFLKRQPKKYYLLKENKNQVMYNSFGA